MSRREQCPIDCKVYVGELGNSASRHDLEEAFGSFGKLRNVWVATNPPGFAFVMFEDPTDAKDACRGLDGKTICGRKVRVEMSSGRTRNDKDRGYGRGDRDRQYSGGYRSGGRGRDNRRDNYRDNRRGDDRRDDRDDYRRRRHSRSRSRSASPPRRSGRDGRARDDSAKPRALPSRSRSHSNSR